MKVLIYLSLKMKKIILILLTITGCLVAQPSNDTPCNAISLSVGTTCSFSTYTNAGATDSGIPDPGCANYLGGDVWFSVTVPASGSLIFDTQSGVVTDGGMAIYSGTNCSSLSLIACNDDGGTGLMPRISQSGLTPGSTIWIRFWEYGNNNNGTFGICVYDGACSTPSNDDCSGAIPVTVSANGSGCPSPVSGTIECATQSSQSTTACGGTEDDDVWFSFTAPANGSVNINLTNVSGSTTDLYHSVWQGTCPSLTLVTGSCSDPNTSSLSGLTPGQTYYLRVYSWTSTSGQNTTFDVCIEEGNVCGSLLGSNICSSAPTITSFPFCANNTWGTSPADGNYPNTTEFSCNGSIDNIMYWNFVANATSVTFNFYDITCNWGDGIQVAIWQASSACGPPGTWGGNIICSSPANANNFSITANGLTIGNTYVLVIDGWAGDQCEWWVDGTGTALPVTFLEFYGVPTPQGNKLIWKTSQEEQVETFIVQKQNKEGKFEDIAQIPSKQNSKNKINTYHYRDNNVTSVKSYYRIKEVDFSGNTYYSNVIEVKNDNHENILIYPSFTEDMLTIEIGFHEAKILEIITLTGTSMQIFTLQKGKNNISLSHLPKGSYIALVKEPGGNIIKRQVIMRR